jgi:hypothetical protein
MHTACYEKQKKHKKCLLLSVHTNVTVITDYSVFTVHKCQKQYSKKLKMRWQHWDSPRGPLTTRFSMSLSTLTSHSNNLIAIIINKILNNKD